MIGRSKLGVLFLIASGAVGCSGGIRSGPADAGASAPSAANGAGAAVDGGARASGGAASETNDAPDAAPSACAQLPPGNAQLGYSVQPPSDAPSAVGGTIADGTYIETSATAYANAGGLTVPSDMVWRFDGNHYEWSEASRRSTQSGTYVVSGTKVTITPSCSCDPDPTPSDPLVCAGKDDLSHLGGTFDFSATDTFSLFLPFPHGDAGEVAVITFVKQ